MLAESLQPALFLHFAMSFPDERFKKLRRRWLLPLVYAFGVALLGLWLYAFAYWDTDGAAQASVGAGGHRLRGSLLRSRRQSLSAQLLAGHK